MDGDDRARQVVLRHLEPVLDRDVVGMRGMSGRALPVPSPEIDPGKPPEGAGAAGLVAFAPFAVLPLEQRACLPPARYRRERIHERLGPFLDEPFTAERGRKVLGQRQQVVRGLGRAVEPPEDGLDRAGSSPERLVAEPVGELERGGRMIAVGPEAARPRQPAMDDRLKRGARVGLTQSFLEQLHRPVGALELGQEHQSLGTPHAALCLVQQAGGDRRRACPLARVRVCARCGQRPPAPIFRCLRRRQAEGVLVELRCERRETAAGRQDRCLFELGGGWGIRLVPR